MTYEEISSSDLNHLRHVLLLKQMNQCAVCKQELSLSEACVDHQHLFKYEALGVNGGGLIRGVLCNNCNALEGKIWNNIHRYGKTGDDPVLSRIQFLENLIAYYKSNHSHHHPTLHPKEKRPEKLKKSEYNQLIKYYRTLPTSYDKNGALKEPPKYTGKWNKTLKELKESYEQSLLVWF